MVNYFGLVFDWSKLFIGVSLKWLAFSLRKHSYSNTLKFSPPKTEYFQIKILIYFHVSAQNIDCGYSLEPPHRGGSNEYHNLCF